MTDDQYRDASYRPATFMLRSNAFQVWEQGSATAGVADRGIVIISINTKPWVSRLVVEIENK